MSGIPDQTANSGEVPPAEALSVIASETRLDILEALWRADERPIRFSDLFDEVDLDDSAQFNYHLKQLTEQFVTKTEAGYDLRFAGGQVIRAIRAGTFTRQPDVEPFEVQGSCTRCGGPLVASYGDEQLAIDCDDCGKAHGKHPFPPGGLVDRTPAEIATAFDERVRHLHCLAADGVCPACSGRMETTIAQEEPCCLDVSVRADHVCQQCRHELCSPVGLVLLDEAAVVAFYDDHNIDLSERPYWTLPWCVDDEYTTIDSRDPWRMTVRIPLATEELRVTLNDDLTVRETQCVGCSVGN